MKALTDGDYSPITTAGKLSKTKIKFKDLFSSMSQKCPLDFAREHKARASNVEKKFYSVMRKKVTFTVQMASNFTGMRRIAHLRCFLPVTDEEGPS